LKQKEQMVNNVLTAFERDGKIYAVPAKFTMPLIFADAENAADMADISSLAHFAEAHPNIGIIGDKTGDNLSKVFLPAGMPGWFDGKEINGEKLAEYLTLIKAMADTPAEVIVPPERMTGGRVSGGSMVTVRRGGPGYSVGESNPDDVFNFAFRSVHTYIGKISGFRSLMMANMACEERGGCIALPLPGMVENVFIPTAVTGINAKSGYTDIARDFLMTMLSFDVQNVRLEDGFPVNIKALEGSMETVNNFYATMASQGAAGRVLSGGMPSLETQQKIMDLCMAAKTPYIVDDTLAEMVLNEAKGYFIGEKDIDKTIADIRERTRLYLAE